MNILCSICILIQKNNSFIFYFLYVINGDIINWPLIPTQFYDIKN